LVTLPIFEAPGYPKQGQRRADIDERHTSEFRYIIHGNDWRKGLSLNERWLSVLIDRAAFNVENLKKLFYLISKRFPEPNRLYVIVSTDLWQTATPEEEEACCESGRGYDPHDEQHPRALLMRIAENELFRYTPEGPPYKRLETVMLKGSDPYSSKRDKSDR
jgi:hypothetical protein